MFGIVLTNHLQKRIVVDPTQIVSCKPSHEGCYLTMKNRRVMRVMESKVDVDILMKRYRANPDTCLVNHAYSDLQAL